MSISSNNPAPSQCHADPSSWRNTQASDKLRIAFKHYLLQQQDLGFKPLYLITWHYRNTAELNQGKGLLLDRKGLSAAAHLRRRCDPDIVTRDAQHIRNLLLSALWGVKRHNQGWREQIPPMFFFNELGIGEQLHTHLLIPAPAVQAYNSVKALLTYCNNELRAKCRSLSRDRTIDVKLVTEPTGLIDYLVKEVTLDHCSPDAHASIPLVKQPDGRVSTSAWTLRPHGLKQPPVHGLPPLPPSRRTGSTWRARP
ncbi:hypothetical protein [Vulcanococcus limneticus]|uniref:hypothetical protein n=1 Tax=Vulcanococcus limneticus TaxID=2170428 RepID=UPI00398BD08D